MTGRVRGNDLKRSVRLAIRQVRQAVRNVIPAAARNGQRAVLAATIELALHQAQAAALEHAAKIADKNLECAWCDSRGEIAAKIRAVKDNLLHKELDQ